MEQLENVISNGKCCSCEKPLAQSQFINVVALDRKASWPYPTGGNVLTGESGNALGFVCDQCVEISNDAPAPKVKFAVEFKDGELVYHDVNQLQPN